jgi:N-acetylglucosamine-6-phosphate deacetylase
MSEAIINARILTPDEVIDPGTILIDDRGLIAKVGWGLEVPAAAEIVDARGLTVVPGYVDLHVHGGGGYSLATRDAGEIESYARWVVSHGVTGFLATIFASSCEEAAEFVHAAGYVSDWAPEGGAEILGINLEGPFISGKRRGALPETWVRPASIEELIALSEASDESIKLMTLAPEIDGAEELLPWAIENWIVVAVGHSDATYEEAAKAFELGASHLTHAFDGMRTFHHRDPGPVLAAIGAPGVTLEIIADGVHLHPATVSSIVRAAGPDRIALVSDGVPPAGLDSGTFLVGEQEARLTGGAVHLSDGTIAGGAATMAGIIRNVLEWQAAPLADAIRMASTVPARVVGLSDRKGRIAPGYDADLVALDDEMNIVRTWVHGRTVYVHP